MTTTRTRRKRIKGRFFIVLLVMIGLIAGAVFLILRNRKTGEIKLGGIDASLEVSAAIVRDETVVKTEPYEKISFSVVEGESVTNDQLIAQLYKRGYQDDTQITLINLQKDIYTYQLQLLGSQPPQELLDINANLATVEEQIRSTSRKESDLDMLTLENSLKGLQQERITLLQSIVVADSNLTAKYNELKTLQDTQSSWRRDILNTAGTGIVSFYFDGYENVLCADKLSTINAALVNSVVKGGNTANTTDSASEAPLYRVIRNNHWYLTFVTKATEPMRLAKGEQYSVLFTDYSDQPYTATALDTTASENYIVNVLEFNTDIGALIGSRTVAVQVSKAAQGLVVPIDAIEIVAGVPGINIAYGDTPLRVEIDILSKDEKNAVIRARNESDSLASGMKYIKP